jgi:hypothetical protein
VQLEHLFHFIYECLPHHVRQQMERIIPSSLEEFEACLGQVVHSKIHKKGYNITSISLEIEKETEQSLDVVETKKIGILKPFSSLAIEHQYPTLHSQTPHIYMLMSMVPSHIFVIITSISFYLSIISSSCETRDLTYNIFLIVEGVCFCQIG